MIIFGGYDKNLLAHIVLVQIRLHTKYQTQDIGWNIGLNCGSRDNLAVAPNTFYEKECALAVDQTHKLECKSSTGDGWNSNFLIIENKAYCEHFTTGDNEVANVTIQGK